MSKCITRDDGLVDIVLIRQEDEMEYLSDRLYPIEREVTVNPMLLENHHFIIDIETQ